MGSRSTPAVSSFSETGQGKGEELLITIVSLSPSSLLEGQSSDRLSLLCPILPRKVAATPGLASRSRTSPRNGRARGGSREGGAHVGLHFRLVDRATRPEPAWGPMDVPEDYEEY